MNVAGITDHSQPIRLLLAVSTSRISKGLGSSASLPGERRSRGTRAAAPWCRWVTRLRIKVARPTKASSKADVLPRAPATAARPMGPATAKTPVLSRARTTPNHSEQQRPRCPGPAPTLSTAWPVTTPRDPQPPAQREQGRLVRWVQAPKAVDASSTTAKATLASRAWLVTQDPQEREARRLVDQPLRQQRPPAAWPAWGRQDQPFSAGPSGAVPRRSCSSRAPWLNRYWTANQTLYPSMQGRGLTDRLPNRQRQTAEAQPHWLMLTR